MPLYAAVLTGLAVLAALLLGTVCLRALLAKKQRPGATAPPVDAKKAEAAAQRLARMVRCETVTTAADPDSTAGKPAFSQLDTVLRQSYPHIFAAARHIPFEDALLLHWPGRDAAQPAVLLMAHSDVVPATGSWQRPPFGGQLEDGRVWGRGAMDTKCTLCAIFEATDALAAEGFVPPCDVYIASSHNEERMGPGAVHLRDWFVQNSVRLALVSDEGGFVEGCPLPGYSGPMAQIALVEKGYANVRFTAKSAGGHASTPAKNTPLAQLAAFVAHVEKRPPFPRKITGAVRQMFAAVAPYMGFGWRLLFCNLWLFGPLLAWLLPRRSPQLAAMLRTTCAFTMAAGSAAPNVIPETASVTANLRFIMHQPMQPSLAAIGRVAQRYGLAMELLYANDLYAAADPATPAYAAFTQCVQQCYPEAVVSPYIMLAGTDARHFAEMCSCTLRFSPILLTPQQHASMHGLDENIGIEALARAAGFYQQLLRGWPQPGG